MHTLETQRADQRGIQAPQGSSAASLQRADVTTDARLIHIGKEIDHPAGVPAYEMVFAAPLVNGQRDVAHELLSGAGIILPLTRSAIAQVGFELDPKVVEVKGALVGVEGYALLAGGEISKRLVDRMRAMARENVVVNLGRVGLFPEASRVSLRKRVHRARERGRLTSSDMALGSDATVLLPLGTTSHVLPPEIASNQLLDRILLGIESGRKILNDVRTVEDRPDFLHPGEFIVTEIDIGSQSHHIVLRPELVDVQGNVTDLRHLRAFLLDAGRTQKGIRHAEVWNCGAETIDLRQVRLRADLYRPTQIQEAGH